MDDAITLDEKTQEFAVEVGRRAAENWAYAFVLNRHECESPIEELLLAALLVGGENIGVPAVWTQMNPVLRDHFLHGHAWDRVMARRCIIAPQFEIDAYRVDFCLLFSGDPSDHCFHIVVECDGHEWHERTAEQAGRDKARDRALQAAGFQVMRFTGKEIWHNALHCASEVFSAAEKEWERRCGRPDE